MQPPVVQVPAVFTFLLSISEGGLCPPVSGKAAVLHFCHAFSSASLSPPSLACLTLTAPFGFSRFSGIGRLVRMQRPINIWAGDGPFCSGALL